MTVEMQEMVFDDLDTIRIPVKIGGKPYVLVEADEDTAVRYQNAQMRATKFSDDGKPSGIDGFADADPFLLSMCLFEVTEKGDRAIPISQLRKWKHRVVNPLIEKVKEISELTSSDTVAGIEKQITKLQSKLRTLKAKDGDYLKNEQDDTTGTSDSVGS